MTTPVSLHINASVSVPPERNEKPGVFLKRNKRNCTIGDDISDVQNSIEGFVIYNGLVSRVDANLSRMVYVLDTEDFLYRIGRRMKISNGASNGVSNGTSNGHSHRGKRIRRLMFS